MLKLDGGTCPTTWRLLGRSQDEVDSARYATMGFLSAPQTTTQVRELLRELSNRHGFTCIDLRQVFAEHTGSALPGRRLFLDYCHLTVEGIQVAMAAVAAEVLRLSGMTEAEEGWRSLLSRLPPPTISAEAEATACFGAAIHSAHRLLAVGPKREILEHWCEEALRVIPEIEATMLDLLEARCAPVPAVLTAAQQRNLASPYRLQLQHGWRWDHLDAELIEAIVSVLERRGRPARETLTRMLLEHHLRPDADLADPFYHWEPLERFFPEAMDLEDLARRATYRSPWPVSSFCLIADGRRDVELELTARLPEGGEGDVEIAVNGTAVGTFRVGALWSKGPLCVPASHLQPGLNRLTLRWPDPPPVEGNPFQQVIERLEQGLAADLHPVFGEIFSILPIPASRSPKANAPA